MPRHECKLLGIEITPVTLPEVLEQLSELLRRGQGGIIAGHNLHSVYLMHTNQVMKEFYSACDMIMADGAPVLWDYHITGGSQTCHRIGSTDWIPHLIEVQELTKVMVVGSTPKSNTEFTYKLQRNLPLAKVVGIPGECWNATRATHVIKTTKDDSPELILLGLGMPVQEEFALRLRKECPTALIATVGGAIDQISGTQKNAPRWLGPVGLEWLWRLIHQPKRLYRRYLIEPWGLLKIRLGQSRNGKHTR